jgi:hypothetical protein
MTEEYDRYEELRNLIDRKEKPFFSDGMVEELRYQAMKKYQNSICYALIDLCRNLEERLAELEENHDRPSTDEEYVGRSG